MPTKSPKDLENNMHQSTQIYAWKLHSYTGSLLFEIMGQSQSEVNNEVALFQIQELYRKFASECPSGNLHLHEFKRIFGITSESSVEESAYMENLFRSFDTNQVSV